MNQHPEEPQEHWEADGERLLIRPIRPADAAAHNAFFHRLSPEDIRLRFFAAVRELTPAQLDKFTRLDDDRDMALIAVQEETGQTVGVARLVREADPFVAEFVVIVQHDLHDRGLATHRNRGSLRAELGRFRTCFFMSAAGYRHRDRRDARMAPPGRDRRESGIGTE